MKKISQKTLEKVLKEGVYDTRKYSYKARYCTAHIWDNNGNYSPKHYIRVERMPMIYFGTASMLDPNAWDIVADIALD